MPGPPAGYGSHAGEHECGVVVVRLPLPQGAVPELRMVWGVPIEYVSHCMGHDSVETTQKFYADYRDKMVLGEVRSILKNNQK